MRYFIYVFTQKRQTLLIYSLVSVKPNPHQYIFISNVSNIGWVSNPDSRGMVAKTPNYKNETHSPEQTTIQSIKSMCFAFICRCPDIHHLKLLLRSFSCFQSSGGGGGGGNDPREWKTKDNVSCFLVLGSIRYFYVEAKGNPKHPCNPNDPPWILSPYPAVFLGVQGIRYFHNFLVCIRFIVLKSRGAVRSVTNKMVAKIFKLFRQVYCSVQLHSIF